MADRVEVIEAGGALPPAIARDRTGGRTILVWDRWVRLFHWIIVALFVVAFVTGDRFEKLHIATGYAIVGLAMSRIGWGFVGTRYALFSDFVRPPRESLAYLRKALLGQAPRHLGHNPAGALMILVLLAMLVAISATGFMMTTDMFWGAEWVEDLHEALVYAMLALIALHVAGVLFASYAHGENLVSAMITGRKRAV